jgi:hypothetical protein
VQGNFIGTDVTGTQALGNAGNGIEVDNSAATGNVIQGDLIADNGGAGLFASSGPLTVSNCTLSGNSTGGIDNSGTLTVNNCTISGNSAGTVTATSPGFGGGIRNSPGGVMTVSGCTLSGNSAFYGGGIYNYNGGTLTVSNCIFSDNSADIGGGGIVNAGTLTVSNATFSGNSATAGGGIVSTGTLTVSNSTFSGNTAGYGGGINNGGMLTVSNSTFSGNSSPGYGGGINNSGTLTISNSTFSGNSAGFAGGGIYFSQGYPFVSTVSVLTNVTIAANRSNTRGLSYQGGGIWANPSSSQLLTLNNTIVAGNFNGASGTTPDDIAGTVNSASAYNLIGTGGSGGLQNGVSSNQVGVADPGLAPLGDFGGPTQTMAPLSGSPALDAGSNALAAAAGLTTDQRGFARIFNGTVDIGAFEGQPLTVTATTTTLASSANPSVEGQGVTFTATVGANIPGSGMPTGTITFYYDNPDAQHQIGQPVPLNRGQATSAAISSLEEGDHPIFAAYSGEGNFSASTSPAVHLTVADAPLTATGQNSNGSEGTPFTPVVATFTDADAAGTAADYTATIDWGDGTAPTSGSIAPSGASFAVSGGHTYDEEGSYTVHITIQDQGGSSTTITSTAAVAVVAPTAGSSGPADGVPGQPRTFTFTATHPSQADTAAGFVYTITWGDGTPAQTIPRAPGNGAGVAVDHVYTAPGSYTVQVTDTEDGGSTSAAVSSTVTIQTVEYQNGTDTLAVGGTTGNDTLVISPADAAGDLNVNLNGASLGNFQPTGQILVYGQTGNDTIQLASKKIQGTTYYVAVPAYLYGGGGPGDKDVIDASGSTANNVLLGGAGSNKLFGGLGRDLLIAGLGAAQLHAGSGEDILIGGWTDYDLSSTALTYDRKLAGLDAVMKEWGRVDLAYTARVNDLLGPAGGGTAGGLNGSAFLNSQTVHDNGVSDTLFGDPTAPDWFFAGGSDVVKQLRTGEVTTGI